MITRHRAVVVLAICFAFPLLLTLLRVFSTGDRVQLIASDECENKQESTFNNAWQKRYTPKNSTETAITIRQVNDELSVLHLSIEGGNLNTTTMPLITDLLYDRLVSVTGISDNHFKEAHDMLTTVQHCLPHKKIIVYDIGLNAKNRQNIRGYSNVELRCFPFSEYSHLPHVKNLHTYAWKPIIIKLVSQEYDVIMYGDSSLRMKTCDIKPALEHLLKFPYINAHPTSYRAIEFTHDGMIKYLHYPKERKDMAEVESLQGGCWLLWANELMKEKLIEPWLDCAVHKECITPSGAKLSPCQFTKSHDGHYIGCHRYDQSAMNLIMAREFGLDYFLRATNKSISEKIWIIKRLR